MPRDLHHPRSSRAGAVRPAGQAPGANQRRLEPVSANVARRRADRRAGWLGPCAPSVTEAALTFRFEGLDWHALEDLVKRFRDRLPEDTGESLWRRYRTAMGLDESDS